MQNIPSQSITITQWKDPVVEAHGYCITDPYVEMFWLPVLGPTATWLLRRFSFGLLDQPDGVTLDIHDLARSLGVAYSPGKHNSFTRALQRCTMFGVAHQIALLPSLTVAVRTTLPSVSQRHLARLPETLQIAHAQWGNSVSSPA